jgi:ADP-ribose pyrophosphatase YjhB (NUDIX family)
MPKVRDSFCSFCGTAYPAPLSKYPRTCPNPDCKTMVWANPIPVAVVLAPVIHGGRTGLLVVRRGIEPSKGKLALPGGFIEEHETWQQGGAREVREETGVLIDAAKLEPFGFTSTEPKPNRVLLFSVAPPQDSANLAKMTPNEETLERGIIFGPSGIDTDFAFPLHAQAAKRWFASQKLDGPLAFVAI